MNLVNEILKPFKSNCSPHDKDLGCESNRIFKSLVVIVIILLLIYLVNKYL